MLAWQALIAPFQSIFAFLRLIDTEEEPWRGREVVATAVAALNHHTYDNKRYTSIVSISFIQNAAAGKVKMPMRGARSPSRHT